MGIAIGLFFRFCLRLRQSSFHYIVSDGVTSAIGRKWKPDSWRRCTGLAHNARAWRMRKIASPMEANDHSRSRSLTEDLTLFGQKGKHHRIFPERITVFFNTSLTGYEKCKIIIRQDITNRLLQKKKGRLWNVPYFPTKFVYHAKICNVRNWSLIDNLCICLKAMACSILFSMG